MSKFLKTRKRVDLVRRDLVFIITHFLSPFIALAVYGKYVGREFWSSELGLLIGLGIVVAAGFGTALIYKLLFPRYSDDFPEEWFKL